MSAWEEVFPILAKHMGEWEGEYVHLDPEGREIDRHKSHLKMWEPEDKSYDVIQRNTYTWRDGRQEVTSSTACSKDAMSTSTTSESPVT